MYLVRVLTPLPMAPAASPRAQTRVLWVQQPDDCPPPPPKPHRPRAQFARPVGDAHLARPWSKHSTGSSKHDQAAAKQAAAAGAADGKAGKAPAAGSKGGKDAVPDKANQVGGAGTRPALHVHGMRVRARVHRQEGGEWVVLLCAQTQGGLPAECGRSHRRRRRSLRESPALLPPPPRFHSHPHTPGGKDGACLRPPIAGPKTG
jgi:hypothetical protein